jgi:hypothetical protein
VGTPEHCLDALADTARHTGIGHFILMVEGAGDRTRTLANITRLGAEVLPQLRDRSRLPGQPVADEPRTIGHHGHRGGAAQNRGDYR